MLNLTEKVNISYIIWIVFFFIFLIKSLTLMMNQEELIDRKSLMEVYQLKTLNPTNYKQDTVQSKITFDLSTEDLNKIPNDVINDLLSDNLNDGNNINGFSNTNNGNNSNNNNNGTNGAINRSKSSSHRTISGSSNKLDYSDALGFHENILEELMDRDIVDDTRDPQLNKFMVGSKSFNPKLFLSVIHGDKSLNQLMKGIDFLEHDIESKKPLLQELIANNFEKTLNTKNSLDKVFNEYSKGNLNDALNQLNNDLASSNNSSNQILNPVLLQISKEQEISNALHIIEQNKILLDLPKNLRGFIDDDDFDSVLGEYEKGKKFYSAIKSSSIPKLNVDLSSTNQNINLLYDKIWSNVQAIIKDYKSQISADLKNIHIENINKNFKNQISQDSNKNNFIILITRILELGPSDINPITEFINSQYQYLYKDLDNGLAKVEYARLDTARNNILNAYDEINDKKNDKIDDHAKNVSESEDLSTTALKSLYDLFTNPSFSEIHIDAMVDTLDLPLVIELWDLILAYVKDVTQEVVSNKILKFESIVEFFIKDFGDYLSPKIQKNSIQLLKINDDDRLEMTNFFQTLIAKICGRLTFVFDSTTSDLSNALKLSLKYGPKAQFPETSKKEYDNPESYGFIPPHSNSISTVCYCVELHKKIFVTFRDLENKTHILHSDSIDPIIEKTLQSINNNIILGCLAVLCSDINKIYLVENWSLSDLYEGSTKLPEFLLNYYKIFISKLHDLIVDNDKSLVDTIQKQILKSFDLLVESLLKSIALQTKNNENFKKLDFYYLTTLSNMNILQTIIIPKVISFFDSSFKTSLSNSKLQIFKSLENYESILFEEYLKPYQTTLKNIIYEGVQSTNWFDPDLLTKKKEIQISNFIMKSINFINTVKSKLFTFKSNKAYIMDVETNLALHLINKLYLSLKQIQQFSKDGLLQITLDVKFLLTLFENFNKTHVQDQIVTSDLQKVYKRFTAQSSVDVSLIEKNVSYNIYSNNAQMKCFLEF